MLVSEWHTGEEKTAFLTGLIIQREALYAQSEPCGTVFLGALCDG